MKRLKLTEHLEPYLERHVSRHRKKFFILDNHFQLFPCSCFFLCLSLNKPHKLNVHLRLNFKCLEFELLGGCG